MLQLQHVRVDFRCTSISWLCHKGLQGRQLNDSIGFTRCLLHFILLGGQELHCSHEFRTLQHIQQIRSFKNAEGQQGVLHEFFRDPTTRGFKYGLQHRNTSQMCAFKLSERSSRVAFRWSSMATSSSRMRRVQSQSGSLFHLVVHLHCQLHQWASTL